MDQQQTQITVVQNENEQLEEQVAPIASKHVYMKFNLVESDISFFRSWLNSQIKFVSKIESPL